MLQRLLLNIPVFIAKMGGDLIITAYFVCEDKKRGAS
jgi:hypothetical protein